VRKRLFCSSHAVLRLRRKSALEKVNGVRLCSMRRNGNPSLRPAAIITPSHRMRAATEREQPQHTSSHSASSQSTQAATAREQPQRASSHSARAQALAPACTQREHKHCCSRSTRAELADW
jgi:hypothetical protein